MSRGPIEIALASPGFRMFWDRIIRDLTQLRVNCETEAKKSLPDNPTAAVGHMNQAKMTEVIVKRLTNAPRDAIIHEQEKRDGRSSESLRSEQAGYATSGV